MKVTNFLHEIEVVKFLKFHEIEVVKCSFLHEIEVVDFSKVWIMCIMTLSKTFDYVYCYFVTAFILISYDL